MTHYLDAICAADIDGGDYEPEPEPETEDTDVEED